MSIKFVWYRFSIRVNPFSESHNYSMLIDLLPYNAGNCFKNLVNRNYDVFAFIITPPSWSVSSTTVFQYLFNFCSNIDTNYSISKQFCCSVLKQLDSWMTTKILNSNFILPCFIQRLTTCNEQPSPNLNWHNYCCIVKIIDYQKNSPQTGRRFTIII